MTESTKLTGISFALDAVERFKSIFAVHARALDTAAARLDSAVEQAVDIVMDCNGKIVTMGMGKCSHVGQKIAATLASTGTPAIFVHPAEAIHGDIGMIGTADVVILISNSGETPEIKAVLPSLKRLNVPIIALTGVPDVNHKATTVADASVVVLDTSVKDEGGPLNLSPMASTTVMMAMGDALASVLMERNQLTQEDYALLHPGGSLGQKLLCTVESLMHVGNEIPSVLVTGTVHEAIMEMTSKRLGAAFAVDAQGILRGIITDGDLRRLLEKNEHPKDVQVGAFMGNNPKTISKDVLAVDALRKMEEGPKITILPVVDDENCPVGALHIHDLIRAGIA